MLNKAHKFYGLLTYTCRNTALFAKPFSSFSIIPCVPISAQTYIHANRLSGIRCRKLLRSKKNPSKKEKENKIPHDNWISIGCLFLVKCFIFFVWDDNFILSLREQLTCPWSNDTEQLPKPVSHPQEKTVPGGGHMTIHVSFKMSLLVPCQEMTFQGKRRLCVWLVAAAVHKERLCERKSWDFKEGLVA